MSEVEKVFNEEVEKGMPAENGIALMHMIDKAILKGVTLEELKDYLPIFIKLCEESKFNSSDETMTDIVELFKAIIA